jgi:hypothetical protein
MRAPVYYHVAPRYSGGSPAQVDFVTAQHVADDERRAYDNALQGAYGDEGIKNAQAKGLKGIVEEREERADCWIVSDLLTGDHFIRLFPSVDEKKRFSKAQSLRKKYHLSVVE